MLSGKLNNISTVPEYVEYGMLGDWRINVEQVEQSYFGNLLGQKCETIAYTRHSTKFNQT